jgi:hypothetical protein
MHLYCSKILIMERSRSFLTLALFAFATVYSYSQNSVPRPLLNTATVNEILGEASGERAMNHIIEMAAYIHDRPASEYSGQFFETEYLMSKLRQYGIDGAKVNSYKGGQTWDGISATLWEVSPERSKLADYGELPAVLASGSNNADVTAELVWVGEGRADDIEKAGVEGKIAVTSGSISVVHSLAVSKGALGVISYNSPRPSEVPLAIPITGIGSRRSSPENTAKFGFFLPPRDGELLRNRLLMREKITVRAIVKTQMLDYDLEVTECVIKGSDPQAGEVILSAHIFEGLVKMGANDNISGSAAILEVARMLNTMINEGRIERPKRTVRFIWVPEFSGTAPWVTENRELMKKTLCNINLDMVGLWLKKSNSFLCMHRTTYGNPHYINDVMENFYDFVGTGNRAGLAISGREGFVQRIVAPTGSDDPFYYAIDDHYGASDHEVFNDWGVQVPGIMMITWPDLYYHTSQDLADKCDPTQLKRVCFIAAAAAYTIASASEKEALAIAAEVAGNSGDRIGKQVQRASSLINSSSKEDLLKNIALGRSYIEAAVINEKATIASTLELSANSSLSTTVNKLTALAETAGKAALSAFDAIAEAKARETGVIISSQKPGALEVRAKTLVPKSTAAVTDGGYRSYSQKITALDKSVRDKFPMSGKMFDTSELARLCNGRNSASDIKKLLDTQMKSGETDLNDIINYIMLLKEAGLVTI